MSRAVQKLKPAFKKSQRDPWLKALLCFHDISDNPNTLLFADFVHRYPQATQTLQQKTEIRLLVVSQKRNKFSKKSIRLLYDGRCAVLEPQSEESAPLQCFLLGQGGRLLHHGSNVDSLPPLSQNFFRHGIFATAAQPLWQLLGGLCPPEGPEEQPQHSLPPQTLSQLHLYVNQCVLATPTNVVARYASGLLVKSPLRDWYESALQPQPAAQSFKRVIHLRAFATADYSIAYALDSDAALPKAIRRGQQVVRDFQRNRELWQECDQQNRKKKKKEEETENSASSSGAEEETQAADPRQANYAAAVSVAHTGLNLAFHLGLVSREELSRISEELGATYASLFVFLDSEDHLRHISYYDANESFCREVPCFDKWDEDPRNESRGHNKTTRERAAQIMTAFWQDVWTRRQHWIEKRRELLLPLTGRLEAILLTFQPTPDLSTAAAKRRLVSPYSRCLSELRKTVQHHRVLLCAKKDAALHSIKFYLAHFAYSTFKRCRGVSLKAQSDDSLVRLSVPGMTIVNANTYFSCQSDADFYAGLWTPWVGPNPDDVVISHSRKDLHNQQPVRIDASQTQTVFTYCKQRGYLFARTLHRRWVTFGRFLLETFGYEIHGQTSPPSASYLAFQCVWTRYAQTAGPLAQAPERFKPYHEDLLRERSRGGFMFSAQEAFAQGQPLFPSGSDAEPAGEAAQSIAEYDLISAYGYAAAQSRIPSGFCTGYEKPDQSSPRLERLDTRARHKSFEFRAVYKAIDGFVRRSGSAVRSLYHNFSPLGIFTLGMYNLDLAVVTEKGHLLLVNCDGNWVHSCDFCPSAERPVKRPRQFVNRQTHCEVREKSDRRDADIRAWVESVNAGFASLGWGQDTVGYLVLHDCHTPGYTTRDLERSFATNPVLAELVRGYRVTDRCGSSLSVSQFRELASPGSENDDSHTFIAKARVSVEPPPWLSGCEETKDKDGSFSLGPLIVYCDDDEEKSQNIRPGRPKGNRFSCQELAWSGTVVLTRDYYRWLETTYGDRFSVQDLDWVLFFKTDDCLNSIYRELVDLRSTTPDPVLVTFIKRIVNLSAGFYGVRNSQRSKTSYRLVNKTPANFSFYCHVMDTQNHVLLGEASYFLLETSPAPKRVEKRPPAKSAVALFLTIVEYGKLRLVEILHFIREHLSPGRCRLVYSNVDNAVVCLSGGSDSLDQAVAPEKWSSYQALKSSFLYEEPEAGPVAAGKTPGLAELKWKRYGPDCDWKFITLRIQHYCIKVPTRPDQDRHKTSGWSDVSSDQVFSWAQDLLQGSGVSVLQNRRISKMFSTETRPVTFQYPPGCVQKENQ